MRAMPAEAARAANILRTAVLDDIAQDVPNPGGEDAVHDAHFLVEIIHEAARLLPIATGDGFLGQGLRGDAEGGQVIQAQDAADGIAVYKFEQDMPRFPGDKHDCHSERVNRSTSGTANR